DPKVVYAIIDCEKIGMGPPPVWIGLGADNVEAAPKVLRVTPGSPGEKAGIKVGDVITAIDKKPIKKWGEAGDAGLEHRAGDKLTFTVQRDKETKDLVLTLEVRPESGEGAPGVFLGLQVEKSDAGLRVALVAKDSPADKAGIRADDLLLEIDRKDVK